MATVDLDVGRWVMSIPALRAIAALGGPEYSTAGVVAPGPLARPERWRQSFAFKLALAIRGVL